MDTLPDDMAAFNQRPSTYYEWKPETVIMAPEHVPIATEQQKTVAELKKVVADLTALVQQQKLPK